MYLEYIIVLGTNLHDFIVWNVLQFKNSTKSKIKRTDSQLKC